MVNNHGKYKNTMIDEIDLNMIRLAGRWWLFCLHFSIKKSIETTIENIRKYWTIKCQKYGICV